MQNSINIFTDGGSRGNPGSAACAFAVFDEKKILLYNESKFLGTTTNNVAEYQGLIMALNWLVQNNYQQSVAVNMDSELVIKQINGEYKVKDSNMRILFEKASSLRKKLNINIVFKHVPRSQNKLADTLVNQELDKNSKMA